VGVKPFRHPLDFTVSRHAAKEYFKRVALGADCFCERRDCHRLARLFERGEYLGPLLRNVNLGGVAKHAPAARVLVELNG
jgi:hypothetical protein